MDCLGRIGSELESIASQLAPMPKAQLVKIAPTFGGVVVIAKKHELLPQVVNPSESWFERLRCCAIIFWDAIRPAVSLPDQDTTVYFQTVFGEKRFKRLLERAEISGDCDFTKAVIEQLFVQAAEVFIQDLEELFAEIKSKKERVLFLDEKETLELRVALQNTQSLNDCTNAELEKLYTLLVPFREIKHIFLNKPPHLTRISIDSGKTFKGKRERVNICETMRRNKTSEECWTMLLAKNLIDRELPKGVVFRSAQGGLCKVHEVVHGGGAFKSFILGIGKDVSRDTARFIFYRGTRPLPATGWHATIADDFREKIGSCGAQETLEKTKALLSDPSLGFVETAVDPVTGVGNSLGGAHVMRDAKFLERLVTVVSPGVDIEHVQQYAELVNSSKLRFKPDITHYFEDQDICDQASDAHIGLGIDPTKAKVRVCILRPLNSEEQSDKELSLKEEIEKVAQVRRVMSDNQELRKQIFDWMSGYFDESRHAALTQNIDTLLSIKDIPKATAEIFRAFTTAHCRNTLIKPHKKIEISNQRDPELLERILDHKRSPLVDPRWERIRRSPGALFSKM